MDMETPVSLPLPFSLLRWPMRLRWLTKKTTFISDTDIQVQKNHCIPFNGQAGARDETFSITANSTMGVGFARVLSCLMHQMKGSLGLQPKNVRLAWTLFNTPVIWFIFIWNVLAAVGENAALCLYDVRFPYCHCVLRFSKVSGLRIGGGEIYVSVNGDNELAETWMWWALLVSCHCVSMLKQFFCHTYWPIAPWSVQICICSVHTV